MKIIYWIVAIAVLLGGLYMLSNVGRVNIEPPFEKGVLHPLDNVKGNKDAKVVLMEYSDFQCPACKSYYPIIRQLVTEFGGEIAFVYRHFPLTSIHPNAEFAARAAEAAGKQGKFWEMHDLLFEKQGEWASSNDIVKIFADYAILLTLDKEKFDTDWRSKEIKNLVSAQRVHAVKSGLSGTPSFFLNGEQIQNPASLDEFRNIIKQALAK
ncbi:MAG: DsbA family protein [Patescibacteria group bacterium]